MCPSLRSSLCLVIGLASACSGEVTRLDSGVGDDAQVGVDVEVVRDTGVADDSGPRDSGLGVDAAPLDSGPGDVGEMDAGASDATPVDADPADMGVPDTGPADMGVPDTGPADMGVPDTGTPDTGTPDAGFVDAAVPDSGVVDGGATTACDVVVELPETNAGQVGASGGSPGPTLECPAGSEIVGVAVRMSDQNTSNGGPSAVGFTLACAPVAFVPTGVTVGPETLPEVMGTGQFGWTPATQSTITRCQPGWLVSGLSASRGASGNRFIEVNLTCTELLPTGMTTGVPRDTYVMGSLQEAGTVDTVACPAGQVVRRLGTRIGAGLDAVSLLCGAPACGP